MWTVIIIFFFVLFYIFQNFYNGINFAIEKEKR